MTHLRVELEVPDTVSDTLRQALQEEAREQTVLALFRRGLCSAGLAAELLGRSYAEFLDFLKERGIDYAPGDPDDQASDTATLRWLKDRRPAGHGSA